MIKALITASASLCLLAACVTTPMSFPPEAQPISAAALQTRLAGKSYAGRLANGTGWTARYEANGRLQFNVSNGTSDKGRWQTEDNRLCVTFEGAFPSGCSEMRADAQRLYLQRSSTGEVVTLTPQP